MRDVSRELRELEAVMLRETDRLVDDALDACASYDALNEASLDGGEMGRMPPGTGPCAVEDLSAPAVGSSWLSRVEAAKDPRCTEETLFELSFDEVPEVRAAVGRVTKNVDTMSRLAQDEDIDTQLAVINNPNCPKDMWEMLALKMCDDFDSVDYLVNVVLAHPRCPDSVFDKITGEDCYDQVAEDLVSYPNCPQRVWEGLAMHPDDNVCLLVANSPNCPPGILVELTKDREKTVRKAAIENLKRRAESHS